MSRYLDAIRIILRPARRPIIQLLGAFGIMFTFPILVILPFAEAPTDWNRIRYLVAGLQVKNLDEALQHYRADCGRYPSTEEGLASLVDGNKIPGWRGPYLRRIPPDPWSRPYVYDSRTDPPTILSYGADSLPGGTSFNADVSQVSWSKPIPESSYEIRVKQILFSAMFVAAVLIFPASIYALVRFR